MKSNTRLFLKDALAVSFVPILGVMRLFRRFVVFKLCVVGAHRFGHLALEPEMYLAARSLEEVRERPPRVDLWSFGRRDLQSNPYLVSLWKMRLRTPPSWLVGALLRAGQLVPQLALESSSLSIHGPANGLDRSRRQIPMPRDWTIGEIQTMKAQGFDPRQKYVALIVRDSAHYRSRGEVENPQFEILNGDLSKYRLTCESLVQQGFQVIRLGGPSHQRLPEMEHVFDYANSDVRNPRFDVLLPFGCSFAISNQTGPDAVALLARRPVFFVDVLRFSQFFLGTHLATWIPVRIVDRATGLPWSLSRLCRSPLLQAKELEIFSNIGADFVRTTSTEIAECVADYAMNLESGTRYNDDALQTRARKTLETAGGDWMRMRFGEVHASPNQLWTQQNSHWWLAQHDTSEQVPS